MNQLYGNLAEQLEPELATWLQPPPLAFRMALWWTRHSPRGKAAIPRRIGRSLCRDMRAVIHTRLGTRLAVDPQNLDIFTCIATNRGTWDGQVLFHCLEALDDGDVFYDIGANAGLFTLEAAAALGDRITVHAFEPQPSLARGIRTSAALNGCRQIHVHELVLGDREGDVNLFVPSHCIHASLAPREEDAVALPCRAETIDNLVSSGRLPPPSVVKIDVEGGEMAVFHGARATIARHRPVIFFEADENAARFGYAPADLCALLRELGGYRFFLIDEYEHERRPTQPIEPSVDMPEGNYLGVPNAA